MEIDADSIPQVVVRDFGEVVRVETSSSAPSVIIVCEHASNRIPAHLNALGVTDEVLQSHVAWDPGALGVAQALLRRMPGVLVAGGVSRLVYDCNRPPDAHSAVPMKSEIYAIPGNAGLDVGARTDRVESVYRPFSRALSKQIETFSGSLAAMVTVHSFTPVFHGEARSVELGLLHGRDDRLALDMLAQRPDPAPYSIRLNEPYAASDGVAHTLDRQGVANALPNVMLEIRNDLIREPAEQEEMASFLAPWIDASVVNLAHSKGSA
ncbi:MAG: N-formylglutamate amidohydrolase [Rhodobacteraceae bacterium]|nr:N-formylglutamate amidohydrolase [Paracoccaceae bacterium]